VLANRSVKLVVSCGSHNRLLAVTDLSASLVDFCFDVGGAQCEAYNLKVLADFSKRLTTM
jgi:hypothetical protein